MANSLIIELMPWIIISGIFWLIVLALIYLLRNKKDAVYVFFPLLVMLKTKKMNNFISKVGKKYPTFWKIFWTIGIFVSFIFMIFALFFFFINLIFLIINPQIQNAIMPLIPGVTIGLPLFAFLIIPILFIMTTHELAHGISASAEDVDVQSMGIMGAGVFFLIGLGAFVEIDERELYSPKHHRNTRLRIAAAGTYVNAITILVAFLLLMAFPILISPFYGNQVVQVKSVYKQEQGGFNYGNLADGDVIVALKKEGLSDKDYVYLDGDKGISLYTILYNETDDIECAVGDKLTLKIYDPIKDKETEKDIILGPRYEIGIRYEYISNSELKITKVLTKEEDGNNYDIDLEIDMIITKINGVRIDLDGGDRLEKVLTTFNLHEIQLTDENDKKYNLDVEVIGVLIGITNDLYYIPLNSIGKFFTGNWPVFLLRELIWLFIIAFSVTILNMLPLPVFDGDRMLKEVINWRIGEDFKEIKQKKDRFLFEEGEKEYGLSEFRVKEVDSIKIILQERKIKGMGERSEIILSQNNYELIDKIGDGFKSTISFKFSEQTKLDKNSIIEVNYKYLHDDKKELKKKILNTIRFITLFIFLGNFILSYIKFGTILFW